jgi:hypothetical protein
MKRIGMSYDIGFSEGEVCGRSACKGIVSFRDVENCSCHLNAPCAACCSPRGECSECGWDERTDQTINDFRVSVAKSGMFTSWVPRALDSSKIDWHSRGYTNSSMIKEGVYPPGTTKEEVLSFVKGTFGGCFEYFGNGKFKYIAYTD